jgi:Zn-dependent protease with chaperone function
VVAEFAGLPLFAWLCTYGLHSSLLLGAAWLVTRRLDSRALGLRERIWKVAVLGGFLTATLQVGLGLQPILGHLALRVAEPVEAVTEVPLELAEAPAAAPIAHVAPPVAATIPPSEPLPRSSRAPSVQREHRRVALPRAEPSQASVQQSAILDSYWLEQLVRAPLQVVLTQVDALAAAPEPAGRETAPTAPTASSAPVLPEPALVTTIAPDLPRAALAGWSLALLACLWLFAFGLRRLRRDLSARIELRDGPHVLLLERLRLRAGVARPVRLWVAPRLAAPLSMGWLNPSVCVPPRAFEELSPEECAAMLAHEVAHLARRDPPWLFALWLIETLCIFQPLNRLARRELSTLFELSADAWAARATGERLALASCLARIAGWIVGQAPPGAQRAFSAAMADTLDGSRPRSRLGDRILRLLDGDDLSRAERPSQAELPLTLALLVGLAFAVPGAAGVVARPASVQDPVAPPAPPEPAPPQPAAAGSEPEAIGAPVGLAPAEREQVERLAAAETVPEATEALFESLDSDMGALTGELELLRAELSRLAPDQRWSAALDDLEARTTRLAERRERCLVLLEAALAEEAEFQRAREIGP